MARRLLLIIPAMFLSACSFLLGAEPVTSEQLLPKRTLAFVKIPNASEFRRKWNASSFGAMQRDPAFRPFFADLERQVDQITVRVKTTLGFGVKELWLALDGEVGLALVHSPESGFAFVGVGELGSDEQSAARRIAILEAAVAARGGIDVRLKVADIDVTSWSIGPDDEKTTFSYFRRGRQLVVSHDLNTVLALAAGTKKGIHESLSANPVYQYIVDQTRASSGEPAVQWYVDPVSALETAVSANLEGNPNRDLVTGLLSRAGVDKLKGIGGSIELASAFADNISRTFGYVEPPAGGLLEALKLPATHQVPPTWVKDDANFYTQINWSGPRFYRALADFFDSFRGAGSFRSLVGSARLPNTETTYEDVMNQLVGPLHVVAKMPRSVRELLSQPAVLAVGVADPKRAEEMIHAIANAAGARAETVSNVRVYKLRFPSPLGGQDFEVAASVAEGALMVSTSPRYLGSVLSSRLRKRPLAQSPTYKQAIGSFPEKTSMISYQRQDRRFEGLYEQIRSGKLQLPLYGGIVTGLGLDFSKLPPAQAIRRYLQTSSSFIEPAEKG
ncbi:MAG TPA: hypothetical protein VMR25_11970, partial [Planctomycetaceae bacterium]|nr:hypothetical protein [Planctomycetaceae bacterium]